MAGADPAFTVIVTPTAVEMLATVKDRRHQRLLGERIEALRLEPEKQGKPLEGEFSGFRSVRAVGQRYRIIYRVARAEVSVYVVAAGLRKEGSKRDIYRVFSRLASEVRRRFGW